METMINYNGKRDITDQFYKLYRQMHADLMQIVNNEIAPRLEEGKKTLRLMHGTYKDQLGIHLQALCLKMSEGRVWITGCTLGKGLDVKNVITMPLDDVNNRDLAQIINGSLYHITKVDDGISGLLDSNDYRIPQHLDHVCGDV